MIKLQNILREVGLNEEFATLNDLQATIEYLDKKDKVLLLTTSNRYQLPEGEQDIPKSTLLAQVVQKALGSKAVLMDVSEMIIHPCEGNVSRMDGNSCGPKKSILKDETKNPSGYHRCWASVNNNDDELWKITKDLFESDAVMFFASVRWGQANAFYQKLIERLTWIENRHTTLGEDNVVGDIDTGFVCTGQNWNGQDVVALQKQIHAFFGFKTPSELYWNWQFTKDKNDESQQSYKASYPAFDKEFDIEESL